MHNNVEATETRDSSVEKEKIITATTTEIEAPTEETLPKAESEPEPAETEEKEIEETPETIQTEEREIEETPERIETGEREIEIEETPETATEPSATTETEETNEKDEQHENENHIHEHDATTEENTILLPEPDKQLVENIIVSDAMGDDVDGDEQAIAIKTETGVMQEDVLAEPLGEEDNLYAANIDVKPIEGVLLKVETVTEINNASDKNVRRRTTRKSAAAAAAAIRVKSGYSPESDGIILRTRSSNKRRLKSPLTDEELSKAEKKKGRPPKIKSEKDSDEDDSKEIIDFNMKQCRICLSKNTLVSIFRTDDSYTVAEKIMSFCNSVKITQKDNLPQFICNNCVQSVNVAFNLKTLCEKTDCELRIKLKRSKIKKERPTVKKEPINCRNEGEDESADENQDKDDDYIVSNESEHSAVESDSDSDFGTRRKRIPRKKKTSGLKKRGRSSTSGINKKGAEEKLENGDNDSTEEDNLGPSKRKRAKLKSTTDDENSKKKEPKEYTCAYCDMKFTSQNLLREHKKNHVGEKPLTCNICNKPFKLAGSYMTHIQKHKDEDNLHCGQCNKFFQTKQEYKKHMNEFHEEPQPKHPCEKCKRAFTTQIRLDKHKDKCPGAESRSSGKKDKKKNTELDAITVGKDLFKCVAPMTTTYWSDSFSE